MQKVLDHAALQEGQGLGGGAFSIKGRCADVARVEAVVVDGEKRCRQLLAQRILAAQAHPIEDGPGVKQAAEGANQIQEGFRTKHAGVMAGVDGGVVQVGDGALGRLVNAAGNIEV